MRQDANPLAVSGEDHWPGPGSIWRQRLRRMYDTAVVRVASVHLSSTIATLDVMGRLAHRARVHGPSRAEVAALYPWLPARRLGGIARDVAALRLKNRAAVALVDRGATDRLASLVRWPAASAGAEPFEGHGGAVVMACHVGAFLGIRAALHHFERQALVLRDVPMQDATSRAAALKRSVDYVRAGGVVVATIDGPGGTSTGEVECLGRRVVLRRGPFVLARLTGAPLIPMVCAWTRQGHIAVRTAPAIERPGDGGMPPLEFENLMAARTARWLDEYLRTEPQEIWLSTLRHYLLAPLIRGTDG